MSLADTAPWWSNGPFFHPYRPVCSLPMWKRLKKSPRRLHGARRCPLDTSWLNFPMQEVSKYRGWTAFILVYRVSSPCSLFPCPMLSLPPLTSGSRWMGALCLLLAIWEQAVLGWPRFFYFRCQHDGWREVSFLCRATDIPSSTPAFTHSH